jgi:hypothetical protein
MPKTHHPVAPRYVMHPFVSLLFDEDLLWL